jgi:hypothetical protein
MLHIAFSQSYFAIQARKKELIEDRMRSRCDAAPSAGRTCRVSAPSRLDPVALAPHFLAVCACIMGSSHV